MKIKKYILMIVILISISCFSFIYLNKCENVKEKIIALNDSDYRVIFDYNYGELVGFESNGAYDKIRDGVYGVKKEFISHSVSQPLGIMYSKRNNHNLMYWSLDYNCSTKDLDVGVDFDATERKVYYACYEQTKFDNDGIRYVQDGAYVSGDTVGCGDAIKVTQCYQVLSSSRGGNVIEYCEFDKISEDNNSAFKDGNGTVFRSKLSTSPVQGCKESVTAYFHEDSYVGNNKIEGDGMTCGSLSTFDLGVCSVTTTDGDLVDLPNTAKLHSDNRKFIGWAADDDGKNVNCSGKLVTSNLVLTENVNYYACYEEVSDCKNSSKISNGKGSYNISVCYNVNNSKLNPVSDDYDDILNCANGYNLSEISKTNIINTTCNRDSEHGVCQITYKLNCTSNERPKVTAQSVLVKDNGYGTILFSGNSKSGIKGWYASSSYEKPTEHSTWVIDSNNNFYVESQPGTVFLWVIDKEGLISYAALASVIDKVNTDTTLKSLEIKTDKGDNLNPEVYAYESKEDGITSSDYVRLSNKVVDESKILANGFNPFDTAYRVTTSSSKIAVYATLTSNDASYVSGYEPRTVDLEYGINTILIKIQNKRGRVRTYTIIATREDDRSSTNLLKTLNVSEGSLNFDPYKSDYIVSVGKNKKSVSISADILNNNAKFVDGFGPRKIELNNNSTTASIKVSSETGSVRSYTITFIKSGEETVDENNSLLSSLSLSKAYIAFDKNTYDYNTTVDYEVASIDIYAIAENGGDSITLYKTFNGVLEVIKSESVSLEVGSNIITIIVSNSEGLTKKYSLNILRKENGLEISSDTKLSMLDVDGYNIEFNPEVYDYEIKIKREKTLVIAATPMSNRADVYIRGNDNLTAFSIVKIKVIAEDGQFKEYTINIQKDAFNKKTEIFGLVGGLIIIVCGIIIIRVKKKRKSINDYYAE